MLKLQAKGVAIWADEHHWTVHCVRSSEWSTFHLHLCISYQCIWGWQHLQKPSPKCHFTYIFLLFLFRSGAPPMTLLTVDCWTGVLTDPRLPATASNVCTTDARLGGVGRVAPPPNKNPGYAGAARNLFTASADSRFHPPLSLVFFFQSSSSPAFLTPLFTVLPSQTWPPSSPPVLLT